MKHYHNFKAVSYCVSVWTGKVTREQLEKEYEFFEHYVGFDKIYVETYREYLASREHVMMVKQFFEEKGIEVSGGITTVINDLNEEDVKRQRIFHTFCYCNEAMRHQLKEIVEFTASMFDEFIIDDFFFTHCTCEDCQREKGNRSWEEFRLAKMKEVSEKLILQPAKKVNPKIKVIIKYPNWVESYQETGYNLKEQKDIFDGIYTGTETRHPVLQDQHMPRYLSYSLVRYMENAAPNKNGGGWFDPYECYPIDHYLEQMYLTAFARAKEIMHFCWNSLYNSKYATPLGFQLHRIDEILDSVGTPMGLPVYIPYNGQGEDHIEDYLGMLGIPLEPTPVFPKQSKSMLLTEVALEDEEIIEKVKAYVNEGNTAIVTSGFVIGALEKQIGIEELTSIRYRGRKLVGDEFQVTTTGMYVRSHRKSLEKIEWPLLEHRNNASWSIMNVGSGEFHASILLTDTYGLGQMVTVNIPDMYSKLKLYPREALQRLRYELIGEGEIYLDAPAYISLFTYDNHTFGLYSYVIDGCVPERIEVIIKGKVDHLFQIPDDREIKVKLQSEQESTFSIYITPGEFKFYRYEKD